MQSQTAVWTSEEGSHVDRLPEIRALVGDDVSLARSVLRGVLDPVLRKSRGLTADTHTEAAWLREVVRGYETAYCPHCLQDPREDEDHLPDCPIGCALANADLLEEVAMR